MTDLVIRSVETILVDLPMQRLQQFATVGANTQTVVIVQTTTEDGIVGVGEAVTPSGPWWGGESPQTIKHMIDDFFAPLVIGASALDVSAAMASLDRVVFGNSFAKAGLEMSLLDVKGKALGVAVHTLLGGRRRDSLACSWPLATGDAAREIEEAEGMIASGRFNLFKLKMGAKPLEEDVARACAVARGLEGRASVRVDPNETWDETAAQWAIPRLADAGVAMIEQPVPRWNEAASARLTQRSAIPVMVDEGMRTPQDMMRIAHARAADLVSLKPMKSGGLQVTKTIADIAVAGGVSLYMGTFLESSIGTAANLQLCATLHDLPYGGELSGPALLAEDLATEPARYRDYRLDVPDGVGIATSVDPDKLRAFRRDRTYSQHVAPEAFSAGE